MREETKKIREIAEEAKKKVEWKAPEVLGAKGKICECSPGPYTYESSPSYGIVCSDSSYIKECDDC